MTVAMSLLWVVLLAAGVAVAVWYGRSWKAVAQALSEAEPPERGLPHERVAGVWPVGPRS